jgi:hypothetical protein
MPNNKRMMKEAGLQGPLKVSGTASLDILKRLVATPTDDWSDDDKLAATSFGLPRNAKWRDIDKFRRSALSRVQQTASRLVEVGKRAGPALAEKTRTDFPEDVQLQRLAKALDNSKLPASANDRLRRLLDSRALCDLDKIQLRTKLSQEGFTFLPGGELLDVSGMPGRVVSTLVSHNQRRTVWINYIIDDLINLSQRYGFVLPTNMGKRINDAEIQKEYTKMVNKRPSPEVFHSVYSDILASRFELGVENLRKSADYKTKMKIEIAMKRKHKYGARQSQIGSSHGEVTENDDVMADRKRKAKKPDNRKHDTTRAEKRDLAVLSSVARSSEMSSIAETCSVTIESPAEPVVKVETRTTMKAIEVKMPTYSWAVDNDGQLMDWHQLPSFCYGSLNDSTCLGRKTSALRSLVLFLVLVIIVTIAFVQLMQFLVNYNRTSYHVTLSFTAYVMSAVVFIFTIPFRTRYMCVCDDLSDDILRSLGYDKNAISRIHKGFHLHVFTLSDDTLSDEKTKDERPAMDRHVEIQSASDLRHYKTGRYTIPPSDESGHIEVFVRSPRWWFWHEVHDITMSRAIRIASCWNPVYSVLVAKRAFENHKVQSRMTSKGVLDLRVVTNHMLRARGTVEDSVKRNELAMSRIPNFVNRSEYVDIDTSSYRSYSIAFHSHHESRNTASCPKAQA